MRRRLFTAVGAVLVLGAALWVGRRRAEAPVITSAPVAEVTPAAPPVVSPPAFASRTDLPPEVRDALEAESQEPLTPPVIDFGDIKSGRGARPTAEPLVPPVIELGEIKSERSGARGGAPTAAPLTPPVIVVGEDEVTPPRR